MEVSIVMAQVLQWVLTPVQGAWTQPGLLASLASPDAFFDRYIALEGGPANSVRVSASSRQNNSRRNSRAA